MNRDRFPGVAGPWARLDGPAGTQMVDVAIAAMDGWMRSGRGANHGGPFAAAVATEECVEECRAAVGRLLGAAPEDGDARFKPNDEVDEMRWVDLEEAAALLSYPHDAELVRVAGGRV